MQLPIPFHPAPDAEQLRERILSLWGAICTAAKAKPDSFFVAYWSRSIALHGDLYVYVRDGR